MIVEDQGFETRYRLLETIRQYGEERLADRGEYEECRRRHASYYLQLATDLSTRLLGPDQIECGKLSERRTR